MFDKRRWKMRKVEKSEFKLYKSFNPNNSNPIFYFFKCSEKRRESIY